jgi:glyoxylase-like metal-dependent hydrolase (beta-lactamase superfamily II)
MALLPLPTIIAPGIGVLCAPNPSEMTLDGTNSYLLFDPAAGELAPGTPVVLIDPGPELEEHLQALAVFDIQLVLITHRHADHTGGIDALRRMAGAPVRAKLPEYCRDAPVLADGEVIHAAGASIQVLSTPGHTSDSISFALAADHALLTGDTVLGRGTTMVAHPDGELAAYLDSLERIKALTGDGEVAAILPGHGPTVPDAAAMVDFYRVHRRERLEQVRAAMADGAADADAVVATVYADVDRSVWPAAKLSVLAQMRFLDA